MTTLNIIGVEPKVLEILGGNPTLPYSIIAYEVGVTRERVRQIARRNGYPPRNGTLKPKICPVCGNTFYARKLYCSRICVYKARQRRIVVYCHQCGKSIERTPGNMRSKNGRYFCNRVCFRRWVGKDHSIAPKGMKYIIGDFDYEVGLRDELAGDPEICKLSSFTDPSALNTINSHF
jgi:hypothetical protein